MSSLETYQQFFAEMINQIQSRVSLYSVILFGSRAKGTFHKYSDYDIVIIADFQEEYRERGRWIRHVAPFVSMDLFCYTPTEFEQLFENYHLTVMDALSYGLILFGADYILPYLTRYKKLVDQGLRRTNCVLIPPQ